MMTYLSLLYELQDFNLSLKPSIYHCKHWINMFILKLSSEIQIELLSWSMKFTTISEAATEATQIEEKLHHKWSWIPVKVNWKWDADKQASEQPPIKHWWELKWSLKNRTETKDFKPDNQWKDTKSTQRNITFRKNCDPSSGPCHCGKDHWFDECPDWEKNKSNMKDKSSA